MTDHDQSAIRPRTGPLEMLVSWSVTCEYHYDYYVVAMGGRRPSPEHLCALLQFGARLVSPAIAALRAELTEARRIFAEYHAYIQIEEGRARDAGITFSEVRKALAEYSDEEVSFSRLVEVMRRSAKVLSEDDIREKQSEVDHFRHCYETGVEVARQLKADNDRLLELLREALPCIPMERANLAKRIEQELGA